MGKITWDSIDQRTYEAGVDHGVLYLPYGGEYMAGVPWDGLTSVETKASAQQVSPLYDGEDVKIAYTKSNAEVSGTINCYMFPEELDRVLGATSPYKGMYIKHQGEQLFGLCYRSLIGDVANGLELGYKLHLLYGLYITDVSATRTTLNNSTTPYEFSFPFSSLPVSGDGYVPTSEIEIDSREFSSEFMEELLGVLYGTETTEPRMPLPSELMTMFNQDAPAPEEFDGYPYDAVYPGEDVFPIKIPSPIAAQILDIGNKTGVVPNPVAQDVLSAGTYRITFEMLSDVACAQNHLEVVGGDDDHIIAVSDNYTDATIDFFDFTLTEELEVGINWVEELVFPATIVSVAVAKIG